MLDTISLDLLKILMNNQKNLIVVFEGEEPILSNSSFNTFFGVSSFEEYKLNFGPFIDNFVPHPSYFNKDKIQENRSWFDSLLELDKEDRLVSMMTPSYEPHAFSIMISEEIEAYRIVTFEDITQTLVKRIMIENNTNIDKKSGAYDKKYFLHVAQSFEDAALFNEKIIGLIEITLNENIALNEEDLKSFVKKIKEATRTEDMLIRWGSNKFLLAFIVDDEEKALQVISKIKSIKYELSEYSVSYFIEQDRESIQLMLKNLG